MSNLSPYALKNEHAPKLKTPPLSLLTAIPGLREIFDKDRSEILQSQYQDPNYRQALGSYFRQVAELLKNAKTADEVKTEASALSQKLALCYQANMEAIFEQTLNVRKSLFSLKLAFENAEGQQILIFPVDRDGFVDRSDDIYWKVLEDELLQRFTKFRLKVADSPCYLSCTFPIDTPDGVRKIAALMEKTLSIAQLDVKSFADSELTIEFMKNYFNVVDTNTKMAYVMMAGTRGLIEGVTENFTDSKRLEVPLGPAMSGLLLSTPLGKQVAGLNAKGLKGINGVSTRYKFERPVSAEYAKMGLLQILADGKVQGITTLCKSDKEVYNTFNRMAIFITAQRALLDFANERAFSNWGKKQEDNFLGQLLRYFNKLYSNDIIELPVTRDSIVMKYSDAEQMVSVSIPIKYKGVASKFRFTLLSKEDNILLEKNVL